MFLRKSVLCIPSCVKGGVLTPLAWQCLDQTLFEKHEGASAGKFTIGLGLTSMNYCTDREGTSATTSKSGIV